MTRHKTSFARSFFWYVQTQFKIVLRNYKTSFVLSYMISTLILILLIFMMMFKKDRKSSFIEDMTKPRDVESIYDGKMLYSQAILTEYQNKIFESQQDCDNQGIISIFNASAPAMLKSTSLTSKSIHEFFQTYRDQFDINPYDFFLGAKAELGEKRLSKHTSFINPYYSKIIEIREKPEKFYTLNVNNTAFFQNMLIKKQLKINNQSIYFAGKTRVGGKDTSSLLKIIPIYLITFVLFASLNITFYKDLLTSKITKFLNMIGYSPLVQFISTQFVSLSLTLPLTLIMALLFQQMTAPTTKISIHEVLMNLMCLLQLHFILNCIILSLYNLLPSILLGVVNIAVAAGISSLYYLLPLPEEDSVLFKFLYFISPLNSLTYFIWYQTATENRGFIALKHLTMDFQFSKPITGISIQLGFSLVVTLVGYILYKMETGIFVAIYRTMNKLSKKVYNLIARKKTIQTPSHEKTGYQKVDTRKQGGENAYVDSNDKLVINNLSKSYATFGDKIKVLKGINLTLNKGEKVALLGHNGCGKTTFLDSLTGMITRSSGDIHLYNKTINGTGDLQGRLGYCPQFTKTIPTLTVLENLDLVGNLYGVPRTETKEILKGLELFKHRKKFSNQLSGGQNRKLGFALAIVSQAPLIILDEPTTGIDVLSRKIIFNLLRKYAKESIVIFSTHLIEEAENYADKVAILSQGELMAFDTVTNIKRKFNIVYNRLRINFLEKVNSEFVKYLKEDYNLGMISETKKVVLFQIKETDYGKLATLYEFIENQRNFYRVESYGIYKASLEEVLNLREFRELETFNTETNDEKNGKTLFEATGSYSTKNTTPFSILKALLYHNTMSLLTDFTNLAYLIIVSVCFFILFNRSNVLINYKDIESKELPKESFDRITLDEKTLQLSSDKKTIITTFDIQETSNKGLMNYIKEKSSLKDKLEVSEIPKEKVNDIYKKYNSVVSNDSYEIHKLVELSEEDKNSMKKEIKKVIDSSKSDLFILELEYKVAMFVFETQQYHLESIVKGTYMNETISEDMLRTFKDIDKILSGYKKETSRVLIVIQKEKNNLTPLLFNLLYTEFNTNKDNDNDDPKKIAELEIIINKDTKRQRRESEMGMFYIILILAMVQLITTIISSKFVDDKESGIHTLWTINGVPKLTVVVFNLIFYTAFIFLVVSLPVIFQNIVKYKSVTSFTLSQVLVNILLVIFMFSCTLTFLSYILNKQAISSIKNGFIFFTFIIILMKKIISIFLKDDTLQWYFFFNPFYLFYHLIHMTMRGEITLETRPEYYFGFEISSKKEIFFANWGMSNYFPTYFFSLFTVEAIIFIVGTLTCVFKLLDLINEWIKRKEYKNVKAVTNTSSLNSMDGYESNVDPTDKQVELKNVSKIYGHKIFFNTNRALTNFNLTATSGEHIGVLGANGGGKTTAFKLITKDIETTFGDIYVANKRLRNIKTGYMGYVPQYEALPANMTPYQVLKFYAILYNWKGPLAEKSIQNILELMKLRKNKYKKISTLSGGNKRKVVMAISILLDKDLMILDEPTTGIDITNCQDIWNVVQQKAKDKTILLASHSTRESEQLTNKIVILIKGHIVASGTKDRIRETHGKFYEVEIEMNEKDEDLEKKMETLKQEIERRFRCAKFDVKNNFKFSCHVEKKIMHISELIRVFAEWREEYDINEFFINESTLEDILRDKLEEKEN